MAPEHPLVTVFGTTRYNTTPRQMVVDSAGTTAYAITLSGLSVISLAPGHSATQPAITGIVNSSDGSATSSRARSSPSKGRTWPRPATALTVPAPTVLGGSCVTFGGIASPLLQTASGQIQAQVPPTVLPGTQMVEVRSLATAQDSAPVEITVRAAGSGAKPPGSVASEPVGARRPEAGGGRSQPWPAGTPAIPRCPVSNRPVALP